MQVAWLYNVRGNDVSYCPVVHAFAVVTSAAAFFYVDQQKVSPEVSLCFEQFAAEICDGRINKDCEYLISQTKKLHYLFEKEG